MTLSLFPVFFLAGLVRDGLGCLYYQLVGRDKAKKAAGTAFGIELFDLLVIATIAKMGWPIALGISYALGTALGTYLAIRYRRKDGTN